MVCTLKTDDTGTTPDVTFEYIEVTEGTTTAIKDSSEA